MVWKKKYSKRRGYEIYTPSCSVGKWVALDLDNIKIYHYPLSGEYHVGNNLVLNCHGTYKSLVMAKRVAQGVIKHGLKWNLTGKSCNHLIIDDPLGNNLGGGC